MRSHLWWNFFSLMIRWQKFFEVFSPANILTKLGNCFVAFSANKQLALFFLSKIVATCFFGVHHVHQHFRALLWNATWQLIERLHSKCSTHNNQKVATLNLNFSGSHEQFKELLWEWFSKEDNVRLNWGVFSDALPFLTVQHLLVCDSFLKLFVVGISLAHSTVSTSVSTMGLQNFSHVHASFFF